MSFFEFPHTRTYDDDLGWLIKSLKTVITSLETMEEWQRQHEAEYAEIKTLYDQVISGQFPDSIKNAFISWMRKNAPDLISEIIKAVFFGLNDNGYFVAYIPDSWSDIIFNTTGLDITVELQPEYGHLVLSY